MFIPVSFRGIDSFVRSSTHALMQRILAEHLVTARHGSRRWEDEDEDDTIWPESDDRLGLKRDVKTNTNMKCHGFCKKPLCRA